MLALLYVIGYLIVAYITAKLAMETVTDDKETALLLGIVWPFTYPMAALAALSVGIVFIFEVISKKIL